ncbi:MAG: hypothetical protein V4696_01960 [Pseudomonadota bacterium]
MARMQFGTTAFERARGDLPELPVINMFAEEAPTEETGIALQSRPPLVDRAASMGSGPAEALFQRDGVQSGALFGLSGGAIYRDTTSLGAVDGTGPGSIAGNEIGVVATMGGAARYYNGTTLADIAFPDSADVTQVFNGASRFWLIRADTGKLYFTPALTATVDALDFITAESLPDKLLQGLWLDDAAILFGVDSVEFWPNTGDPDLPIAPLEGRVFEKGIKATGCAVVIGATFAWVTDENQVCLTDPDNVISNPGLEEKIEASTECRLFTFLLDGTEMMALRIDAATYVFNPRSQRWSQFASYGEDNWLPRCYAGGVFGDDTGRTLAFTTGHADMAGIFERRFRAGFPLNSGGLDIDNIVLRCNVGQTPYLTGEYTDPVVEMRLSWDAGQTWDEWEPVTLGEQGQYDVRVMWAGLGMASYPGLLVEFRVSDSVPWRVSDVLVNEQYGSR